MNKNKNEEKAKLLKFAQIIENLKSQGSSKEIQISLEDQTYLEQIRDTYIDKKEYFELINNIMNAPLGESISIVNDFYKNKEKEDIKEKTTEEEISKTFGVDPSKIQHLFLKNGKEIFYFYSFELEKDIILENSNRGKSLTDILEENQTSSKKYQLDNEENNTNQIMMDERLNTNLELKLYSPEEVLQHPADINYLNENEKKLLNYLLRNKEKLDIKSINIENLIYITNNHEIKEISFDKDFNPTISSPESEENDSSENQEDEKNDDIQESFNSSDELNDMINDSNNENENDDENENENEGTKENNRQYVFTKKNEGGFIRYVELLILLTSILTILYLSLKLFSVI